MQELVECPQIFSTIRYHHRYGAYSDSDDQGLISKMADGGTLPITSSATRTPLHGQLVSAFFVLLTRHGNTAVEQIHLSRWHDRPAPASRVFRGTYSHLEYLPGRRYTTQSGTVVNVGGPPVEVAQSVSAPTPPNVHDSCYRTRCRTAFWFDAVSTVDIFLASVRFS